MIRKRRSLRTQALPSQEEVLLDYAKRLRPHKKGRRAVHLHLSRLGRANQHPHDINIAASHFDRLTRKSDGQLFRMANCDIVFVGKGLTLAELDDVVLKLRYMFRDDACLRDLERVEKIDPFCTHYDMEQDYDAFLATARSLFEKGHGAEAAPDSSVIPFDPVPAPTETSPAGKTSPEPSPAGKANDSPFVRFMAHSPVFAWSRNDPPTPILSEIYLDAEALKQWFGGGRNITNDQWLLRTLAKDINEDTINLLLGPTRTIPTAITIPVLPETVMTPDFLTFNTRYRAVARTPILFECSWSTVMRNPHLFLKARDRILETGHKICIDGWDPYAFAFADPARLDAHFYKLAWRETLHFEFRADWITPLSETIRRSGTTKVILTDCTSHAGASFGQKLGILLYQGRHPEEQDPKSGDQGTDG